VAASYSACGVDKFLTANRFVHHRRESPFPFGTGTAGRIHSGGVLGHLR
jgi:hypothetical protein